ncbi:MAG: hypothetical protein AB4426_17595 [Xenococcaceae cyanobacterium]
MEIYVRSCGFSQEDGYHWLPEIPSILTTHRVTDLIQSEVPSLVLGRYEGKFLLLVTGFEARERRDFRDRKIRNSVAWVGEDSDENERKLRAIAVKALRGELKDEIDAAINFDEKNNYGFRVDFEQLKQLKSTIGNTKNEPPIKIRKIAPNSSEQVQLLADEIEGCKLPEWNDSTLVVVTGIKKKSALTRVWRGLSSLVEKEELLPSDDLVWRGRQLAQNKLVQENLPGFLLILMILMGLVAILFN